MYLLNKFKQNGDILKSKAGFCYSSMLSQRNKHNSVKMIGRDLPWYSDARRLVTHPLIIPSIRSPYHALHKQKRYWERHCLQGQQHSSHESKTYVFQHLSLWGSMVRICSMTHSFLFNSNSYHILTVLTHSKRVHMCLLFYILPICLTYSWTESILKNFKVIYIANT